MHSFVLSIKIQNHDIVQKQPPELFYENGVLKNFAKFTGKYF